MYSLRSRTEGRFLGAYTRSWRVYNASNVFQSAASDGPWNNQLLAGEIIDVDPSTYKRSPERVIRPVWHHRERTTYLLGSHSYRDYPSNWRIDYIAGNAHTGISAGNAGSLIPFCSALGLVGSLNTDFLETVSPGSVQSLVNGAMNSWAPIPTTMSFANDLLEIAELKGLARQFRSAASSLSRLVGDLLGAPYGAEREALHRIGGSYRSFARSGNSSFLAFNFGVKPLLKTAKDLALSVDRIGKRLSFLRTHSGRLTTLRYRRSYQYGPTPPPSGWGSNTPFQEWQKAEAKYDVTISVNLFQTLEGLYDFSAWLKAFRDYAGFNQILSTAWNALPFSFVADWFTNVADQLDEMKQPSAFEGTYNLSNPCTSVLAKGRVEYIMWHYPANAANSPLMWSAHEVKKFVRFPGLPSAPAGSSFSWPSWFQQVLLGSLAYQAASS